MDFERADSRITYLTGTKALFHLTNCYNLPKCLKDINKVKNAIENGEMMKRKGKYSVNSKKTIYQTILFLIDNFHIPIDEKIKDEYKIIFDVYKLKSKQQTENNKTNEDKAVITFPEYIDKIKKTYGEGSKQYIIACMYSEVPCRDNFNLLIVKTTEDVKSKTRIILLSQPTKRKKYELLLIVLKRTAGNMRILICYLVKNCQSF